MMGDAAKKSLTLVIPVYNSSRYLQFIFAALRRQSMQDFEIIVADDGSGSEVAALVDLSRTGSAIPLQHVWQPDEGFRKNAILNKAITASQTDYLVFIDGDCIPHGEFLRDHWMNHRRNTVLCGRRVNFSKEMSEQLELNDITSGKYEKYSFRLLLDGLLARSSNLEDGIRINSSFVRGLIPRNQPRILGSNFSVEKSLLEKINGFNEDYKAYGLGEDSEIAFRLQLIGASFASLRYSAVLYHLYHPQRGVGEENKRLYEQVLAAREPVCRNGLRKMS